MNKLVISSIVLSGKTGVYCFTQYCYAGKREVLFNISEGRKPFGGLRSDFTTKSHVIAKAISVGITQSELEFLCEWLGD